MIQALIEALSPAVSKIGGEVLEGARKMHEVNESNRVTRSSVKGAKTGIARSPAKLRRVEAKKNAARYKVQQAKRLEMKAAKGSAKVARTLSDDTAALALRLKGEAKTGELTRVNVGSKSDKSLTKSLKKSGKRGTPFVRRALSNAKAPVKINLFPGKMMRMKAATKMGVVLDTGKRTGFVGHVVETGKKVAMHAGEVPTASVGAKVFNRHVGLAPSMVVNAGRAGTRSLGAVGRMLGNTSTLAVALGIDPTTRNMVKTAKSGLKGEHAIAKIIQNAGGVSESSGMMLDAKGARGGGELMLPASKSIGKKFMKGAFTALPIVAGLDDASVVLEDISEGDVAGAAMHSADAVIDFFFAPISVPIALGIQYGVTGKENRGLVSGLLSIADIGESKRSEGLIGGTINAVGSLF